MFRQPQYIMLVPTLCVWNLVIHVVDRKYMHQSQRAWGMTSCLPACCEWRNCHWFFNWLHFLTSSLHTSQSKQWLWPNHPITFHLLWSFYSNLIQKRHFVKCEISSWWKIDHINNSPLHCVFVLLELNDSPGLTVQKFQIFYIWLSRLHKELPLALLSAQIHYVK